MACDRADIIAYFAHKQRLFAERHHIELKADAVKEKKDKKEEEVCVFAQCSRDGLQSCCCFQTGISRSCIVCRTEQNSELGLIAWMQPSRLVRCAHSPLRVLTLLPLILLFVFHSRAVDMPPCESFTTRKRTIQFPVRCLEIVGVDCHLSFRGLVCRNPRRQPLLLRPATAMWK